MTTTIQINDDTIIFLKQLREQYESPSYDALIKTLIQKTIKPKRSLWGKGGKMGLKEIMAGLRDENDRY